MTPIRLNQDDWRRVFDADTQFPFFEPRGTGLGAIQELAARVARRSAAYVLLDDDELALLRHELMTSGAETPVLASRSIEDLVASSRRFHAAKLRLSATPHSGRSALGT